MNRRSERIRAALETPKFERTELERCAASLLQRRYLGIAWVHGGNDGGVDLEIPDGEGEPWPGICTTDKDVARNLRKSLTRYKKTGGRRKKVLLVTSRSLTAEKRRNLRDLAREKGFRLVETIDQENLAELLYHSPRWSEELIRVPAEAPVLSPYPKSARPARDIELVGREEDLAWLCDATGDRLLVGEPGSGKTFLLRSLAREGWGLFVVSKDPNAIYAAILEERPRRLIVDDVLEDGALAVLASLRQLRTFLGSDHPFDIVATTWPSIRRRDAAIEALGIDPDSVRTLLPMTQKEILGVFESCGISEAALAGTVDLPADAMRWLIDQAANRPGLAVTLAELWHCGALAEVLDGSAITRNLTQAVEQVVGADSSPLLACFALGGTAGVHLDRVAEVTKEPPIRLFSIIADQIAGGVLIERGGRDGVYQVRPGVLRPILVRDFFFADEGPRLPFLERLLDGVEDRGEATSVMVESWRRGGRLESIFLMEQLAAHGNVDAWCSFAEHDERSARWTLDHYPSSGTGRSVVDVARETLEHAPAETIDRLLDLARPEQAPTLTTTDQPLRILADWMEDFRVGFDEILKRRELVADRLGPFLDRGGDRSIAVEALFSVLSPKLEVNEMTPLGDALRLHKAVISRPTIAGLGRVWSRAFELLVPVDASIWQGLSSLLWHYAYPETLRPGSPLDAEHKQALQALGGRMLSDLAAKSPLGAGLRSAFTRLARRLGRDSRLDLDPDFELLFPEEDLRAASAAPDDTSLATLAERWSEENPKVVAARLAALESEARIIGQTFPRNTPAVAKEIARQSQEPESWAFALIDVGIPGDVLEPFLEACLDRADGSVERLLVLCLERSIYPINTVSLALRLDGPPGALRTGLAVLLPEWARVVRLEALRGSVPPTTLAWLFGHASDDVAVAAAIGAWQRDARREPPKGLEEVWQSAIMRHCPREMRPRTDLAFFEHDLAEIFVHDPVLAEAWVAKALTRSEISPVDANGALGQAIRSLDESARERLVTGATSASVLRCLARWLVNRSETVYEALLNRSYGEAEDRAIHCAPLVGKPDAVWEVLAIRALEHGYGTKAIADASIWGTGGGYGGHFHTPGDGYWMEWAEAFRMLESKDHAGLREIGREGRLMIERMDDQDRVRARRRALYG